MDHDSLIKYRNLIGQKVYYYKQNYRGGGTTLSDGKLLDVGYNDDTKTLEGVVEVVEMEYMFGNKEIKTFPVRDLVPNVDYPSAVKNLEQVNNKQGNRTPPINFPCSNSDKCFTHDGQKYESTSMDRMKVSDDVVWVSFSYDKSSPLTGKIKFIGKRTGVTGTDDIIAVVQFDHHSIKYPRFVKGAQANQNVVNVNELTTLAKWIENHSVHEPPPSPGPSKTVLKDDTEKLLGIQGKNNSCYMDASIYSLFRSNEKLEKFIFSNVPDNTTSNSLKSVLISKIVKPLRDEHLVKSGNMNKLREILADKFGPQYLSSFMDVEEFMISLFTLLGVPEMITYNHQGSDYIHQILLPKKTSQKKDYINLQSLLESSFSVSKVKLVEIPKAAFIIKLPISDGKLIPCKGVIPSVKLNLSNILDKQTETVMTLHAVICLRNNHFVAFVRIKNASDGKSFWEFMDSQPHNSKPEVCRLKGVSEMVKKAEKEVDNDKLPKTEPECGGFKLFRDAYICVYLQV